MAYTRPRGALSSRTIASRSSGLMYSSASTHKTLSWLAASTANCFCAPNPSHSFRITRAPWRAASSTVSSVEPESTTTTSSAKATLARQRSSWPAALRVMMATDKGMVAKGETANPYNQRLMRHSNRFPRLAAGPSGMKRILIVKTSSLGDIVHNLPVASDIRRHFPDARIDSVVEEPYAPLASLHSAIRRVIPIALRRWRRRPLGRATWKEIGEFRRLVQTERYDAVVDTQGLVKSALIARAAMGVRHGFDSASAREPFAARFYDVAHHVARAQHAVSRNRALGAAALGYRVEHPVEYGLVVSRSVTPPAPPYAVLLHGSSRRDKLWSEAAWTELGRALAAPGIASCMPW